MSDNHDSLIREVKEELEREKYARLWDKYGKYVIGAVVAVVAGVGGYKYFENAKRVAITSAGASYEEALGLIGKEEPSADESAKAAAAFKKMAADGPGGYRALAALQLAGSHVASGDKSAALSEYDALAKQADVDSVLRDFAALQAASLRVGDGDWTEIENRLTPLTGPGKAWRFSALQLLGIAAYQAGKPAKARSAFEQVLGDLKAPASTRERASLYMAKIVADEMASGGGDGGKASDSGGTTAAPASTPSDTGSQPAGSSSGAGAGDGATGAKDGTVTP